MTDLADHAAVVAAGWVRIQTDRGAGRSPRYVTEYGKTVNTTGAPAWCVAGRAESDVSQATADSAAVTSVNGHRKLKYGAGSAAGTDGRGNALTFDA